MTLEYLQNYWWLLISILGGILVFMLFVQGGQSMLIRTSSEEERRLIVNSVGRKWELSFTSLVVFGGAFFAAFPLFYSTSFGGAYWLWMLILFSFIIQAVSYEYRDKLGNLYGRQTYDVFLFINGCVGPLLLGVAVATFFFGADFYITRSNLINGGEPVISRWAPTHGFEAIFSWKNLLLGVTVLFLSRTQAALYMINNIDADSTLMNKLKERTFINGGIFVVFFLAFFSLLMLSDGYTYAEYDGYFPQIKTTPYKYLYNYIELWWAACALILGVVFVLYAIFRTYLSKNFTKGIWFSGIGTFLVVASLFWVAGYNNTAYYPSALNASNSLTIRNSSSSEFTLTVMSYVSIFVPFVLAYIAYVWRAMDKKKLSAAELRNSKHKY